MLFPDADQPGEHAQHIDLIWPNEERGIIEQPRKSKDGLEPKSDF